MGSLFPSGKGSHLCGTWNPEIRRTEDQHKEVSMVKAVLHGACGRMGHMIADIVSRDPEIEIVAGIDAFGSAYADFPVYASLEECREGADVIIDFSTAAAVDGLLAYSAARSIPAVVCTTGLSEEQTQVLKKTAEKVAVLKSANMSIGINLLLTLLAEAAPRLRKFWWR